MRISFSRELPTITNAIAVILTAAAAGRQQPLQADGCVGVG